MARKPTITQQKEMLRDARGPKGGALATNGHNLCAVFNPAKVKVYIWYRPQQTGRGYQCAAWQAVGIDFETAPTGHWRDHKHKTFNVFGRENKQPQLEAAIQWATEQGYGTEWVKDVFGDYQTVETIEKYSAWLAEQVT